MSYYRKRLHGKTGSRFYKQMEELAIRICAAIIIVLLIASAYSYLSSGKWKINIKDVSAMRIPYNTAIVLQALADTYSLPFPELLALYAVDNDFYAAQMAARSETEIVQQYITEYSSKKKIYGSKLNHYTEMFNVLFSEIKYFPVLGGDENYMYGDSFGASFESGKKEHTGSDIIDRENRAGRLEIVNMSSGVVESFGLDSNDGYYIGIRTVNDNYYYYAHFDSVSPSIEKGKSISAGEILGYMGSTGKSETQYGYPVRLHLGIKISTPLSNDDIWVNPYIFLRIVESVET